METKQKFKRENFKKIYDFKCCKCEKELWAKPSMMMTGFGMNQGHGSCPDCKTFFHLEIDGGLDGENMICIEWDEFLKKEKLK